MPPMNILGALMLAGSFGLAYGILALFGAADEFPLVILGGLLCIVCDGLYRWKTREGHWLWPSCGGSLCYLPIWLFGAGWVLGFGIRAFAGEEAKDLVSGLVIGGLALGIVGVWVYRNMGSQHSSVLPLDREWECARCGQANTAQARRCAGCGLSI